MTESHKNVKEGSNLKSVYPNLDDQIKKQRLSYTALARIAGISRSGLYRRLWGETNWKLPEAIRICKHFNYYDVNTLFFRIDCSKSGNISQEKIKEVV